MRLYPEVPAARLRTLRRDVTALALLGLLAWIGLEVHDAVEALTVLGEGVEDAGGAVQGGFDAVAGSVGGAPVIGDRLAEGLRAAGES
nr:hypothetical protein [Actinomycetota bacterium]